MPTIEDVKRFGKIEYDVDDFMIELCLTSSIDMLTASGVLPSDSSLYHMAVCRLALHYYENREELSNFKEVPLGISTMIEQLRNAETEV